MRIAKKVVFVIAVLLMGLQSSTCEACARPRRPPDIPCIGFVGNNLVLELGTIFQTNQVHSCAAAIGLVGPPGGLDFSVAQVGVVNTVTNAFAPSFILNRNPLSDAAWPLGTGAGMDLFGAQALPGATWFGFSNLVVPPVTPPPLGANEIFAMAFTISTPFLPSQLEGLKLQYGSGIGDGGGLPIFNFLPDPTHSSQFSGVVNVPQFGTTNWVPEPATWISAISALTFVVWRQRFRSDRQRRS
jgi:hypothetical protein